MTRRKFLFRAAVLSAFVISIPFVCNEKLAEVHYSLSSDKISAPIKLAFISDLHNTRYGHEMSELVASVDGFSPDAVIFGGDLFNMHWDEENSICLIKKLLKKYQCYYSLGNHEYKYYDDERIINGVTSLGLNIIDGKYADITADNGGTIRIMGIYGIKRKDQLNKVRKAISEDITTVLINHFPEDFPKLSGYGFDLILSGHAHGGQWRFPPFNNGIYSVGEGFFPKYAGGLYVENGCAMIVSRGLERCWRDLIVPRVFNRPEIVLITIMPQ